VAKLVKHCALTPGPDSFQAELIKTMPPEQLKVIQQWLDEILATGEIVTKVTEEDMTVVLSLLHKGGPLADQPSHWRPVVLLNSMNQLVAYIINERLTELVERGGILTQAQGGFRQTKAQTSMLTSYMTHQGSPTSQTAVSTSGYRLQERLQLDESSLTVGYPRGI